MNDNTELAELGVLNTDKWLEILDKTELAEGAKPRNMCIIKQ